MRLCQYPGKATSFLFPVPGRKQPICIDRTGLEIANKVQKIFRREEEASIPVGIN